MLCKMQHEWEQAKEESQGIHPSREEIDELILFLNDDSYKHIARELLRERNIYRREKEE